MKGSIGGLREIGYNEASTQDDKIISGNTFIFDGNFNHTYVMNLVGSYWNVTGNIIRAPRLNASREFGAINFPVTDIYPIALNIKTRFPFYAVIANNLIDVRISSIKLPNNPIKASANPSLFIVRFDDNHNLNPKDWIKFSEGASYGGVRLDVPFQVVSILSAKTITINAPAITTATADGGGGNLSVIFEGPEVMGPDPADPTKNIVLPPPSVAPLNLKRNYMVRQSVISGNLFIGGNYSGLPTGHPTEPTLCKQIVSGNMWAVSDFFTLGDLQLINTAAAANSAVTLDETYFDELASSLREEPNSLSPKYRITGTDPNGIMIDAGFGSFFEVDTSSSSVNVKGIVNGGIGDTIMLKRKQGTVNTAVLVHGSYFRTKSGANITLNTDIEYVIMRKVTRSVWIEEGGYYI